MLKDTQQEELLLSQPQFIRFRAAMKIAKACARFSKKLRREKLEQRSALRIQTFWRNQHIKHKAYIEKLGINRDRKIYFLKE
jgi:hypothetical protein